MHIVTCRREFFSWGFAIHNIRGDQTMHIYMVLSERFLIKMCLAG